MGGSLVETFDWVRLIVGLLATAVVLVFAAQRVLWLTKLIRSGQPVSDERGRKDDIPARASKRSSKRSSARRSC